MIYSDKKRWCHREVPVTNGVWKPVPPYWQYPGCENQPYDIAATTKCMKGRTLYAMGNSVGRQNAFGMVELLGGASVKRENQRDKCPKHETTWDDSCHQDFAGVKIKYLFIQYMDGFNYTDRHGAPFWKQRVNKTIGGLNTSTWTTGRLPNGTGNTLDEFSPGIVWADDNCILHKTRECFARFFNGSTENDVFIFTLGMSYLLDTQEEEREAELRAKSDFLGWNYRAWLTSSAVNFKGHLAATFKGHVFRVTMAKTNQFGSAKHMIPKIEETNKLLAQLWQPDSTNEEEMWYTIDQWAINDQRDYLYNDHVHFNGPLAQATLHQVLNELCPGGGNSSIPNPWPKPSLRGQLIRTRGDSHSYYFISEEGYRYSVAEINGTVPWYLKHLPISFMSKDEILEIFEGSDPIPNIPENCLVKGSGLAVYWVKQGKRHMFPSSKVFFSYGFDFANVVNLKQWVMELLPLGDDVEENYKRNQYRKYI